MNRKIPPIRDPQLGVDCSADAKKDTGTFSSTSIRGRVKKTLALTVIIFFGANEEFIQVRLKMVAAAGDKQCEVVLVGCGAPKRGMGWYHGVQMLKNKCPSAKLCFIIEPWFMGGGTFVATRNKRESSELKILST